MSELMEFAKSYYRGSPNWRERLADALHSKSLPCNRREEMELDIAVRCSWALLRLRDGQDSKLDGEQLRPFTIARVLNKSEDYEPLRVDIECRVLAGESCQSIVKYTGLSAAVLEAYELCHFDVRPRLSAIALMHHSVLETDLTTAHNEMEGLLKYFAYTGGISAYERLAWLLHTNSPALSEPLRKEVLSRLCAPSRLNTFLTLSAESSATELIFEILGELGISHTDVIPAKPLAETKRPPLLSQPKASLGCG